MPLPSATATYIQKVELTSAGGQLIGLQMEMLLDNTRRVANLKHGVRNSQLARDVAQYIYLNISRKIITADIAEALGMNRMHLCEHFRQDGGITIGDFITNLKMDEAKQMREVSSLTVAEISEYQTFLIQTFSRQCLKHPELHTQTIPYFVIKTSFLYV